MNDVVNVYKNLCDKLVLFFCSVILNNPICLIIEEVRVMFKVCKEVLVTGTENVTEIIEACPVGAGFIGGMVGGALIALGIFVVLLLLAGVYVYTSLAWYSIAKKLKYKKTWLAWIPIVRTVIALELGGFHWALIFLIFVPVLGWIALFVLFIISFWKICAKANYPGWFSLGILIPEIGGLLYFIALGIVAWSSKKVSRKKK